MAQEIELGVILEDAVRLTGREPQFGISAGWKALAALQLNFGLRELAAEKFPMMIRYEYRRYRPTWDAAQSYTPGKEVWWWSEGADEGDYYRCLSSCQGVEPHLTPEKWEKLTMDKVNAFVDFSQPWEAIDMDPASVDYTDFAFAADPRYNPTAPALKDCRMSEMGVLIGKGAPKGVWCNFVPVYPVLNFNDWDASVAYRQGQVVYLPETKDCYRAVVNVAAGGESPANDDGSQWVAVRVRAEFQAYLTRLIAVDLLTEDQGKYQTRARADDEFETLCARYGSGSGKTRGRVGSFHR